MVKSITSFFDKNYQSPKWFNDKLAKANLSRRAFLKSASGASAVAVLPVFSLSLTEKQSLATLRKTDPWLTLDATLMHLLPKSASGPSAKEINALAYLHQVMSVQPTEQNEKEFIINGVGWLNDFAQSELGQSFIALSFDDKETLLRGISRSRAGENWLTTLLAYLSEALLSPPVYGGNPEGLGWQWLEHQAAFPLPKVGQRYFELPKRALAKNIIDIRANSTTKNEDALANRTTLKSTNKS